MRGTLTAPRAASGTLPRGWCSAKLLDVAEINPTNPTCIPPDDAPVSFIPMAAVEAITGRIELSERRLWQAVRKGYTRFQDGDILVAKITPCMENGKIAVARQLQGGVGAGSTEFHVLRPTAAVSADLLRYYVLQESFRKAARAKMAGTAGQLRVPSSFLEAHLLPVPPLPEQHRIVEAIESYFTRLDDAAETLARVQRNLKRYRTSVLKAAVEGRLVPTEAQLARAEGRDYEAASVLLERILAERRRRWEEAGGRGRYREPVASDKSDLPGLPDGWCWATVDQLTDGARSCGYGVLVPGPEVSGGVPLVRVGDINDGRVAGDGLKRISRDVADQFKRTFLRGGEVLITLVGTIGRTAVAGSALAGANVARAVGVIPATSLVDARWIEHWFRSPRARARLEGKSHEVARKTLNLEDVRAAAVALPPSAEQAQILTRAATLSSLAAASALSVEACSVRAARLRHSILKWAFQGELADQDPEDEPASALLERIKAERGPLATSRKNGRPSRPARKTA